MNYLSKTKPIPQEDRINYLWSCVDEECLSDDNLEIVQSELSQYEAEKTGTYNK